MDLQTGSTVRWQRPWAPRGHPILFEIGNAEISWSFSPGPVMCHDPEWDLTPMLPCPEASQVALTFLGSKSEGLSETHLAGFCDDGGCVSSGHLLPLSMPWDREPARTPPWEPFGLGLLGRGSSILRHGQGAGGGGGGAVPRRCGHRYSPHRRDRRA